MKTHPEILDPQLMLAHAWNVIQNVKAQLPKDLYDRVTEMLKEFDKILYDISNGPETMTIPMLEGPCTYCQDVPRG